jgi:hypothetical protein
VVEYIVRSKAAKEGDECTTVEIVFCACAPGGSSTCITVCILLFPTTRSVNSSHDYETFIERSYASRKRDEAHSTGTRAFFRKSVSSGRSPDLQARENGGRATI